MGGLMMDEFIKDAIEIQSKMVKEVLMLADKYEMDRNEAVKHVATTLMMFSAVSDVSDFEI